MVFNITQYNRHNIVKDIAKSLDLTPTSDCLEQTLTIPRKLGSGKIMSFSFENGIGFFVLKAKLKEDWTLVFANDAPAPMQFNFVVKGTVKHYLRNDSIQYHLNPLQSSITAHPSGSSQRFKFLSGEELLFATLLIDRKRYAKRAECFLKETPKQLAALFKDVEAKKSFCYQGQYSICMAACIRKIMQDKNIGLTRSVFLESKILELFSMQIKQYKEDVDFSGRLVVLKSDDIEKIKVAKNMLIADLTQSPTIAQLAKLAAINRQKLKVGFKQIFDATINKYLLNERMEQAAILLLKGFNVRETATRVGYRNQSHFARRFKEKYGLLPKDYLKNMRFKIAG